MLWRITLEPKRLPLVPLPAAAGWSAGSSNTCEPLLDEPLELPDERCDGG